MAIDHSYVISPVGLVFVVKAVAGVCKAVEQLELGEAPPSSSSPFDLVRVAEVVEEGSWLQAQTLYPVPGQGEGDQRTEVLIKLILLLQCMLHK